jgi:hypothetical protein
MFFKQNCRFRKVLHRAQLIKNWITAMYKQMRNVQSDKKYLNSGSGKSRAATLPYHSSVSNEAVVGNKINGSRIQQRNLFGNNKTSKAVESAE